MIERVNTCPCKCFYMIIDIDQSVIYRYMNEYGSSSLVLMDPKYEYFASYRYKHYIEHVLDILLMNDIELNSKSVIVKFNIEKSFLTIKETLLSPCYSDTVYETIMLDNITLVTKKSK